MFIRLSAPVHRLIFYCTFVYLTVPTGTRSGSDGDGNQFLMTFVVLVLAVLLFMMRPVAFGRRSTENAGDKPQQPPANGGGPPAPAIH